jgi:hypothetical protein
LQSTYANHRVILLSTCMYEHLEMFILCLGMLLGLPHLQMASWRVFITSPHNCKRWIEAASFCRQAHRISTVHCPAPWPRQSTVGVCSSRSLDPTVPRQSGAHRTVRCCSPRVPRCGPLCTDCPVPDRLPFTVRCATSVLADCHFMDFFAVSLGFFCS